MSVDGQNREAEEATAGLPLGSPVSSVPFAIYIADIRGEVEGQVEGYRGILFVGDVTWVEGEDMPDLVAKLERCAKGSLRQAENSAVRFGASKAEDLLLSKSSGQWKKGRLPIRVGDQQIFLAKEETG